MKAIMVMFDTLSRRFLSTYGNTWVKTPNFERLQRHCTQFDQFYSGSLPCMPARRELHTGRYNFLHRGWGPLEPFDDSAIELLKKQGVYTHIVSDHNHYWEDGGATYVTRYSSWEGFRGQEGDAWVGIVDQSQVPVPKRIANAKEGHIVDTFYKNCTRVEKEADFSSIQTMQAGIDFIEANKDSDAWFLQIECFDPHEPFHVPQRFIDLYTDVMPELTFDWPPYAPVCESEEDKRQVIIRYAALISMCDEYLGNILDTMDRHALWDDTLFLVNTDHGFLMGEHNWWGKSVQPIYQEIAHLPFYLHIPKAMRSTSKQLAQTIDIAPTLLDYFGVEKPVGMLGKSLIPVVEYDQKNHDALAFGYFGSHVNVVDGTHVYMRSSASAENLQLFEYTLMPTRMKGFMEHHSLCNTTLCDDFRFLKGMKVLKVPSRQQLNSYFHGNKLYNITNDYEQQHNLDDIDIELAMLEKLRGILIENEAPIEQYVRLGISQEQPLSKEDILVQRENRCQERAIHTDYEVNDSQLAKLHFIKSNLPSSTFTYFMKELHTLQKQIQDVDACIDQLVEHVLKASNVGIAEQNVFLTLLRNVYDIT